MHLILVTNRVKTIYHNYFFRLYISTVRPTKAMKEIISLLVHLYIPNYFHIKNNSHCQEGAKNFYKVMELSKDLCKGSRETVERVLQDNAYWAHPEKNVIAMLADKNETIRLSAVLYIR